MRQVGRGYTLAFACHCRRNGDHVALIIICKGVLDFGAQHLVCFRGGKTDVAANEALAPFLVGIGISAVLIGGTVVIPTLFVVAGHIGHASQYGVFAAAVQILFLFDGHIKGFHQNDEQRGDQKAQHQTGHSVFGVAGGVGGSRLHSIVHNLGGRAFNNVGNPLGNHVGNGICQALRFCRVCAGHIHGEDFGFVHCRGGDHAPHLAVAPVGAGVIDHVIDGASGVQNYNIGRNQTFRCRNVAGGDAEGCVAYGQVAVIHIKQGGGFIKRGDRKHGVCKGQDTCQNGGNNDHPKLSAQSIPQTQKINFYRLIIPLLICCHLYSLFIHSKSSNCMP